jgi:hypothetical protein
MRNIAIDPASNLAFLSKYTAHPGPEVVVMALHGVSVY